CSRAGRTYGWSRSCSGTPRSRRRRSTPTSRWTGCAAAMSRHPPGPEPPTPRSAPVSLHRQQDHPPRPVEEGQRVAVALVDLRPQVEAHLRLTVPVLVTDPADDLPLLHPVADAQP